MNEEQKERLEEIERLKDLCDVTEREWRKVSAKHEQENQHLKNMLENIQKENQRLRELLHLGLSKYDSEAFVEFKRRAREFLEGKDG